MSGLPVTIRLLDPPLHEFVPKQDEKLAELAADLGIELAALRKRADALHETNPMMGHRGVPARHQPSRDHRDAGSGDLRGRRGALARRQEGRARDHDPGGLDASPSSTHQYAIIERVYGEVLDEDGPQAHSSSRRHDDRGAARGAARRPDRRACRVLLVRHQRSDADDVRVLARRYRRASCRST